MDKKISKHKEVVLDTNIFIYYFNSKSEFYKSADLLITNLITNKTNITTTVLTLSELLSFQAPSEYLDKLEFEFLQMPNLELKSINQEISKVAASIRRSYNFKLVDSIQLASAVLSKAQVFITNDDQLKSFKEIKVMTLKDL